MVKKLNSLTFSLVIVAGVLFLAGCGSAQNTSSTQQSTQSTQEVKQATSTDTTQNKNVADKSEADKICAQYCTSAAKDPDITLAECNGYCPDAIKYCKTDPTAQHADIKSCVSLNVLGKLMDNHPAFKARVENGFKNQSGQ